MTDAEANEAALGARLRTHGRDDPPGRRWGQAALLGTLVALFVAPGFGFPILSGGPRYWTFFFAVLATAILLTLLFRRVRANRAVVEHERGIILVRGEARRAVLFSRVRRARYEPADGRLSVELEGEAPVAERWPPALGHAAVTAIGAQLSLES